MRIFISYSRVDANFANKLARTLTESGFEVWIDVSEIQVGTKWSNAIQQGLDASDIMVLIVSPDAMTSEHVADEWQYFLDKKKPIVPVLFREAELQYQLRRLQFITFEGAVFTVAFRKLHDELQARDAKAANAVETQQVVRADTTLTDWSSGDGRLQPNAVFMRRYKILDVLGGGGAGTVYQARDLAFPEVKRLVAIKEIVTDIADPVERLTQQKRFARETNLLAALNHRAIPTFLDVVVQRDRNYIVMQYISGTDLEHLLARTRTLPLEKVIEWAIELCDVLHYLHTQTPEPIIFRDVKPANIMIDTSGHVRLVDFGLAKSLDTSSQRHTMIGSEGYSPPEYFRGVTTPLGDIYQLGATLHHVLTRKDPRLEPPLSFADRPIRELNPDVPVELEDIVMRALAPDPGQRFKSAQAMQTALQKLFRNAVFTVESPKKPENSTPVPLARTAETECLWQFKTEDEIRFAAAAHSDAIYVGSYDHHLYALNPVDGQLIWRFPTRGGVATTPELDMDNGLVLFGSEDRNFYALKSRTGRIVWKFTAHDRIRSSPALRHGQVFFGSDDSYFYALTAEDGRMAWKFYAGSPVRCRPAVTDEYIIFGSELNEVACLNIYGYKKWVYRTRRAVVSSTWVDLEEGLCYFGSQDYWLYCLDTANGLSVWRFRTNGQIISSPLVHEQHIYFGSADGGFYAVNKLTGREVWRFEAVKPVISSPIWHDGTIYFGGTDDRVYAVDAETGKLRWQYQTGGAVVASPVILNDVIFVGSTDHTLYALKA